MPQFATPLELLDRQGLQALQLKRLLSLLTTLKERNPFYTARHVSQKLEAARLDEILPSLPLTTRAEIENDQLAHPPFGTNLTWPLSCYSRFHQTSGSNGVPVRWLDTADSWAWFKQCWRTVLAAAGVGPADRIVFTFSFGPFIGFWGAFEAGVDLGALCLPAGGMSTAARLRLILENNATVVCCTPTYTLRMAEVAATEGLDLAASTVKTLVVAGEPGGNIPATRALIEAAWGARVFDHAGMTEIGAWGYECRPSPGGLHIIESEFIAEIIPAGAVEPRPDADSGELVLTNLGRLGSPLIRYRTGDTVRLIRGRCACGSWFARAQGGILGRADDMIVIRGNNVFPSAIEGVLREFPEIAEFRLDVRTREAMTDLEIAIEPYGGASLDDLEPRVREAIRDRLHFHPTITLVSPGVLPRFEMKAKRVTRDGG